MTKVAKIQTDVKLPAERKNMAIVPNHNLTYEIMMSTNLQQKSVYPDAFPASIPSKAIQGGNMDEYLRTRIDEYFDSGFGKTTGIDHALEIIKIYAGSASADPDKIPKLFQTLVEQFEPRKKEVPKGSS